MIASERECSGESLERASPRCLGTNPLCPVAHRFSVCYGVYLLGVYLFFIYAIYSSVGKRDQASESGSQPSFRKITHTSQMLNQVK